MNPYYPVERCPLCDAPRPWRTQCRVCGEQTITAVLRKRPWQGDAAETAYAGQTVVFVQPMETDVKWQWLVRLITGPLAGSCLWIDADDLEPLPDALSRPVAPPWRPLEEENVSADVYGQEDGAAAIVAREGDTAA
jgi:hypothetical protein